MNTYYIGNFPVTDELYHYGIQGQKWGVRRYQNPDGTLTSDGRERYAELRSKYDKYMSKKDKNDYKVNKAKTKKYKRRHSILGRYTSWGNASVMNRFDRKIATYEVRSAKNNAKAQKVVDKILKEFGSTYLSDLKK